MYIVEMILDGFKSYAHRTVISGFDQEFNAFTGFNGHGKSNVLDAICFVLGISNLSQARGGPLLRAVDRAIAIASDVPRSPPRCVRVPIGPAAPQVRAKTLNDLIYKQGQAGVTKASVTLVFDNTDPNMKPAGHEQFAQITVTRQVRRRPAV